MRPTLSGWSESGKSHWWAYFRYRKHTFYILSRAHFVVWVSSDHFSHYFSGFGNWECSIRAQDELYTQPPIVGKGLFQRSAEFILPPHWAREKLQRVIITSPCCEQVILSYSIAVGPRSWAMKGSYGIQGAQGDCHSWVWLVTNIRSGPLTNHYSDYFIHGRWDSVIWPVTLWSNIFRLLAWTN